MVLVCGQFADVWNGRLTRIRVANSYLDERLSSLTRSHYLLRLSHQRLEHEMLVRQVTLRDLLSEIQPACPIDAGELSRGDALLRLLAGSCELEVAALYRDSAGRLDDTPIATLGGDDRLRADDPLIALALQGNRLVHVRSSRASTYDSRYLVCAPIVSSNGSRLGILTVTRMPFFAVNEENLQFIAVILGYYADGVLASSSTSAVMQLRPDCPREFALELIRMKRLYDTGQVDSSIVAMTFEKTDVGQSLLDHVRRTRRSTDVSWEIDAPEHTIRLLLLPLAGAAAVEGMLIRIEESIRQQYGSDFSRGGIGIFQVAIGLPEPEWTLDDFLHRVTATLSRGRRRVAVTEDTSDTGMSPGDGASRARPTGTSSIGEREGVDVDPPVPEETRSRVPEEA
ncbi:MAG: PelD GGDEF domain-containing protein [Burkholderiaceae bacterium]